MARKRNGVITDFNQLHWVWKLLLISGTFGVINAVIRRAKGEPDPRDYPPGAYDPDWTPVEGDDMNRNQMPPWLRQQMHNPGPTVPYQSLSSAPANDTGSWQSRWDQYVSR